MFIVFASDKDDLGDLADLGSRRLELERRRVLLAAALKSLHKLILRSKEQNIIRRVLLAYNLDLLFSYYLDLVAIHCLRNL